MTKKKRQHIYAKEIDHSFVNPSKEDADRGLLVGSLSNGQGIDMVRDPPESMFGMTYEQVAAELDRIVRDEPDIHTTMILYHEHLLRELGAEKYNEFTERWRKERPQKPEPLLDLWRNEPDQKKRDELLERWRKERKR